jgi:cysteinyl-tRNA synthetase
LESCRFLGINPISYREVAKLQRGEVDEVRIESLIADRNAARKGKDFKESDRIRDELAAMGVVLKDSKDGTTWEVKR